RERDIGRQYRCRAGGGRAPHEASTAERAVQQVAAAGTRCRWNKCHDAYLYGESPIADYAKARARCYWRAQTIRWTHIMSSVARVRSGWSALSDLSSTCLAVWRFNSLTITSPALVLRTTRSPRRTNAAGETTITSPSR